MRLIGDGLRDFGAAIAHVHAIEAREGVQQAVAVAVGDVAALAAGDDALRRLAPRELPQMGRWVEKALAVPTGQFVIRQHHRSCSCWGQDRAVGPEDFSDPMGSARGNP